MKLLEKHKIKHEVLSYNGYTQIVKLLQPITVYKKLINYKNWRSLQREDRYEHQFVVTMYIPEGTLIHCDVNKSTYGLSPSKCRAEFAMVTKLENMDGGRYEKVRHYPMCMPKKPAMEYKINEFVFPDKFSEELDTCAAGIHFFLTKEEAWRY